MKTVATAIAFVGLLVSGAVFAQAMFRGDAAHNGTYRGDGLRELPRVKWKFPTGDRIVSSPVYNDGVIYFGSDDGNVYAVDAGDGRQLWKRRTKGLHGMQPRNQTIADPFDVFLSSPVVVEGSVFFGSGDGHVYSL
ncbi:MAG: PQQ-binding-like beta-propeller repeat protein, partial [Casimicrobiaceae bacterium]